MSARHREEPERAVVASFILQEDGTYELNSVISQHGDCPGCSIYDVDLSKSYGYVFHQSGAGFSAPFKESGIYWSISPETVTEKPCQWTITGDGNNAFQERNATRRLEAIPWDMDGAEDILEWLHRNALQDETVYCSTCEDYLPSESLCEHCWYCNDGGYKSPGVQDYKPCFDSDCWECHQRREAKHKKYWDERRYRRFKEALDKLEPCEQNAGGGQ